MQRVIHEVVQGSDAWHAFRFKHHGASEASAMLGLSRNVTRTELIAAKATGIAKEFSDFVQKRVLDKGHEVEALARPIIEEMIGEELFPATYSCGKESASCDGLTIDGTLAFECKQWERGLAAAVKLGELPEEHWPQCQQVLHCTGAERLIFAVSDGTKENTVTVVVLPNPAQVEKLLAGWAQFDKDVAEFKHVEVLPPPTADVKLGLPALSIQVNGSISLIDNLPMFGAELTKFIENVDRNPSTDQAFADTEAAIKTLEKAQAALEAAESSALAQTASIDEMRRTVEQYVTLARTTRLMLEKIVKARKDTIRIEIIQKGKSDFAAHIASLTQQIGRPYMPEVPTDFAGVIKNKRTITSLHDAVDSELARAKIVANEIAGRIQINMATLRELASDYVFLFNDAGTIVQKANDDLTTLVKLRISEHKAAEQKKADEQREKIRQEEAAKLAAEADAKRIADEKAAAEQVARAQQEAQLKADADARKAADEQRQRDEVARLAREADQRKEDEARALARAEQDKKDAIAREEKRKADEQLGVRQMMVTLCDRCADAKEYAGVVKAINSYFAKTGDPRRGEEYREAA